MAIENRENEESEYGENELTPVPACQSVSIMHLRLSGTRQCGRSPLRAFLRSPNARCRSCGVDVAVGHPALRAFLGAVKKQSRGGGPATIPPCPASETKRGRSG